MHELEQFCSGKRAESSMMALPSPSRKSSARPLLVHSFTLLTFFTFLFVAQLHTVSHAWIGHGRPSFKRSRQRAMQLYQEKKQDFYSSPLRVAVDSLFGTTSTTTTTTDDAMLLLLGSSASYINAAASLTQETCRLLGVKSIGVDYGLARTGIAVTVGYEVRQGVPLQIQRAGVLVLVLGY